MDGLDLNSARSNGAYAHPECLRGFLDLLGKLRVPVKKESISLQLLGRSRLVFLGFSYTK